MSFVDLLRIHAGILLQKNQGNKVLINKKKIQRYPNVFSIKIETRGNLS